MFSVQISVTICQHTCIYVRTLIYFKYMNNNLVLLIIYYLLFNSLLFDIQLYYIVNYIKSFLHI